MANPNFSGTWKNQHKSILKLTVNGNAVTGTFQSGVGAGGQPIVVDVQGRTIGDRITFNAVYEQFGTLVSWVGQVGPTDNRLETVWLHATNIEEHKEAQELWSGIRTGGDVFDRQ